MAQIHGGQIVARALKAEGVDAVFALTGGHIVPILDGCVQEGIKVIDVRHEQTAAHAAEAYTRLTGRLGVAAVTAGPGVTDTITGVATAFYSCSPMLVLGGRHMIRQELKGGLQEMDHISLLSPVTRWSATAWQVDRLAEYIATAARHAFAGRGGPVFLDIPMDVQFDMVEETAVRFPERYRSGSTAGADAGTLDEIIELLAGAERLMVFAGTGSKAGRPNRLTELVEILHSPTYVNSAARGSVPFGHPLLGSRARSAAMAGADVVLALGVDWDFRTGYGEKIPRETVVIQVDAEPTKIGWNRTAEIGVVAEPMEVVAQLVERGSELKRPETPQFTDEILELEKEKAAAAALAADDSSSPVMADRFGRDVGEFFGRDSIVAVDGGDIVSTTARWLQTSTAGHLLDPGPFGTLGTGAPYAIAAKVAFPDKKVGIVFGDGGFGFNGMEYDTMVRLDLPIVGVIGNDGAWSNIKSFHRVAFPDRLVASDLGVRTYHEMVKGLGGYGEFVEDPADLLPALKRAEASGLPALVNVHLAETMRMSSNYSQ